jgi:hypothetical protein
VQLLLRVILGFHAVSKHAYSFEAEASLGLVINIKEPSSGRRGCWRDSLLPITVA